VQKKQAESVRYQSYDQWLLPGSASTSPGAATPTSHKRKSFLTRPGMSSEEKKIFLLLQSIIFQYHGLDDAEQQLLQQSAEELQGREELNWAQEFIAEDYLTAFDRARAFLQGVELEAEKKLDYLYQVWLSNNAKGYITEMEATAMLRLARDWKLEGELVQRVRG
jgi:hypothetical protein